MRAENKNKANGVGGGPVLCALGSRLLSLGTSMIDVILKPLFTCLSDVIGTRARNPRHHRFYYMKVFHTGCGNSFHYIKPFHRGFRKTQSCLTTVE